MRDQSALVTRWSKASPEKDSSSLSLYFRTGTFYRGSTDCSALPRTRVTFAEMIGYSFSASILLLLMGRDSAKGVPDRAIAVNPPVDLEDCSRRLPLGFNRFYDNYFIGRIRREVQTRLGATALVPTRTTRDFDSAYVAAMAGFPDRASYYAHCSCGPHLGGIRVPTVIITCRDDPFAPAEAVLKHACAPLVHLHVERSGGHMGYVSQNLRDRRWLGYALDHYLGQLLGPPHGQGKRMINL